MFERRSCGTGTKGPRLADWALTATAGPRHFLLIRRLIYALQSSIENARFCRGQRVRSGWCSCPAAGCCISKHLGLRPAVASGKLDEMESAHPV